MTGARSRSHVVDVARGTCLVLMTIDHLPRNILGRFSNVRFGPFGFFTGASGFVFLSGLVSAWVYGSVLRQRGYAATSRRALQRAATLYGVNTILFLLVFGGVSLHLLTGPRWESEFQPIFTGPGTALARGLLLLYRPGFLDILPMYCFFLIFVTPALAAIDRGYGSRVMGFSALLWVGAQVLGPLDPNCLNPLGYQILFVAGLIAGSAHDLEARLRAPRVRAVGQASLALATLFFLLRLVVGVVRDFDPPVPYWLALTHLENNGPLRVLNFCLFALASVWLWQGLPRRLKSGPLSSWLAHLGQHSLQVFAWSVAATYVSLALLPRSPSRGWSVLDMTLSVLSLTVPAQVHGLLKKRGRAESQGFPAAAADRRVVSTPFPNLPPLASTDGS
jgi:hypothetical protein